MQKRFAIMNLFLCMMAVSSESKGMQKLGSFMRRAISSQASCNSNLHQLLKVYVMQGKLFELTQTLNTCDSAGIKIDFFQRDADGKTLYEFAHESASIDFGGYDTDCREIAALIKKYQDEEFKRS